MRSIGIYIVNSLVLNQMRIQVLYVKKL